jgi:general stress protein YciG
MPPTNPRNTRPPTLHHTMSTCSAAEIRTFPAAAILGTLPTGELKKSFPHCLAVCRLIARRPREEVRAIAAKGGHASHTGGFASMDPERQREIASLGGHASKASDKPGNFADRPTDEMRETGKRGAEARQVKRDVKEEEE